MSDILLDTHIFLWLLAGDIKLSKKNTDLIDQCTNSGNRICLSAISIWEIAMLDYRRRIQLTQSVDKWLSTAVEISFVRILELSPEILIDSCRLPGDFHADPADRMIVSTSRINNIPLLTQDERILSYITQGFCPKIEE
ncbi:MAG: type II toxin-antitoxin system VapC family toxin [Holosporaceae bacterium]|jgi:PIN domain nuclease of toxin-antitoxin system|nr:type II toxin-antitoxin system VapC family toxin [Holosporaceae bacterium]